LHLLLLTKWLNVGCGMGKKRDRDEDSRDKRRRKSKHKDKKKEHKKKKSRKLSSDEADRLVEMILTIFPESGGSLMQVFNVIDSGGEVVTANIKDRRMKELLDSLLKELGLARNKDTGGYANDGRKTKLCKTYESRIKPKEQTTIQSVKDVKQDQTRKEQTLEESSSDEDDVGPAPANSEKVRTPLPEAIVQSRENAKKKIEREEWMSIPSTEFGSKNDQKPRMFSSKSMPSKGSSTKDQAFVESSQDRALHKSIQAYNSKRETLVAQKQEQKPKAFEWNYEQAMQQGNIIDSANTKRIISTDNSLSARFSKPQSNRRFL